MKRIFKIIVALVFVEQFQAGLNAQQNVPQNNPKDSVEIYCAQAKELIQNEPVKALVLAKKAYALSVSGIKTPDASKASYVLALVYRTTGEYDSALVYFNLCYKQRLAAKSKAMYLAEPINGTGIVYSTQGKYDLALEFFMRAQKVYEDAGDSARIAKGLNNIASVYYSIYQPDKALLYFKLSLAIKERLNIKESVNAALINMSAIYTDKKEFENAKKCLDKALKYALETNNVPDMGMIYSKLAWMYSNKKEYGASLKYNEQALKIQEELQDEYGITECLLDMGNCYSMLGDSKLAILNYNKALEHAYKANTLEQIAEIVDHMSAEYMVNNDYKNAYKYLAQYLKYYTNIQNEKTIAKISEMQEKYEAKQKEKNIEKLNVEKAKQEIELYRKKTQLNTIIIISAVLILLLTFIYYRYSLKQKNKSIEQEAALNRQRLEAVEEKRLLQEKQQNELLNVVINAQEEERKKIAIDIHDGLGQLLSGVKMNLELALNRKDLSPELAEILANLRDISEDSISESKSIASDLLPYNIKDFGLVAAIKNLCYKNNLLKVSAVKFYSNDVPRKLPPEIEIALYRITQELINNALKHAKASEIFVQIFYRDDKLILQVEDNGIGFSPGGTEKKESGMGLRNMAIRVQLLAGHLEIDSVPGKGTTTVIEIPLQIKN